MKRILLLISLGFIATLRPTTFTVINTNDSGAGSLRQAITDANADATPPTLIAFNIPGAGPHTITPTTFFSTVPSPKLVFPPLTQPITIDGASQPGFTPGNPQIVIDCTTVAAAGGSGNCLTILGADNCVIKGLAITKYVGGANGVAIRIKNTPTHGADNNQVTQCVCGSLGGFGNTRGIVVDGSASASFPVTNTIIGGPNAGDGNVLSGNSISGFIGQFNVQSTLIQNNFMGCDKTGTVALGNAYAIAFIGDITAPCNGSIIKDNVIAGNSSFGIVLQTSVNGSIIQNNKIGTNISGTAALGSAQIGVIVNGDATNPCNSNLIGGSSPGQGNLISGNTGGGIGVGVYLIDNANNNSVQGNFIGTNLAGTAAIPNLYGVIIQNDTVGLTCTGNVIGGSTTGARNLISGNTQGISFGNNILSSTIQNNFIGVTASGTAALANTLGINLSGITGQPIDGTTITANVISGNTTEGIFLGNNTVNSVITRNFIGTDLGATINLGNGSSGITFNGDDGVPSTNNKIGTTNPADKNTIMFNGTIFPLGYGIFLGDNASATPDIINPILGNSIFNNNNKGIKLLNNGNHLQPFPTITKAQVWQTTSQVRIQGSAPATPAASNFRIEFFVNSLNRNPITEGQTFIGAITSIPSGAAFDQILTGITPALVAGQWVSATATNLNNTSTMNSGTPGDTSEFSLNQVLDPILLAILSANPTLILPSGTSTLTLTIVGDGPFTLVWSDGLVQTGVTDLTVTRVVHPTHTTTYSVTVTDSHNSSVSASARISTSPESVLTKAIRAKYCRTNTDG